MGVRKRRDQIKRANLNGIVNRSHKELGRAQLRFDCTLLFIYLQRFSYSNVQSRPKRSKCFLIKLIG